MHKIVNISFHIFHTIGLKTVFEVETCRVINIQNITLGLTAFRVS